MDFDERPSRALSALVSELEKINIRAVPAVTSRGKLYESFVFLCLVNSLVEIGYTPVQGSASFDLNAENALPYRQLTRSSEGNLLVPYDLLVRVLTPKLILSANDSTLNLFYQGFPLGRGRQRPDITILQGQLRLSKVYSVFGEGRVKMEYVYHTSRVSLVIRPVCDTLGPIFEGAMNSEKIPPDLILEVFLSKPVRRLKEQFGLYSSYQPRFLGYVSASKVGYRLSDERVIIRCDELEMDLDQVPRFSEEVRAFVNRLTVD